MKVVILAGGFGTRISEETDFKPKPIIEIGTKPILCHIMKIYSHYGFNDFVICLGYKGYVIKEYFANYFLHQSDLTIDLRNNDMQIHQTNSEPWVITLVDTGLHTMTGGRIKAVREFVGNETFMLTYGDGVGNIDISKVVACHRKHGKYATVTAVQPSARFGLLNFDDYNNVLSFYEKPKDDGAWINGGFFVLEPQVFDLIQGAETVWEKEPMEKLAEERQLITYKHHGFWRPMDTLRDKRELEEMWSSGRAAWKVW